MATARRTAPAARGRAAAAPVGSGGYRGAAGLAKMREEEKNAEARKEASQQMAGMPFRFFCPVGETREITIIDDGADLFFRYEHNLKDKRSGKWNIFTACINENANCPVCKVAERDSYFAMFLTVIDHTPYVNKDNEEVPWSKKLLVVKSAQQKKIMRIYEREGTLRGVTLAMTRDGDKDAAIGNDIELVEILDEDALLEFETTYTDNKGKEHDVIGHEVFDYDELFPAPTEESLRAIAGGKAEPGSRDSDREALGGSRRAVRGSGGDGWDDERPARTAVRGRTRAAEPVEEDEVEEEAPPARGARRAAPAPAAPARRGAVRRAAPVEDEDLEQDLEEAEAPAPRRGAPTRAAAPVRRAARPEPEDEAPEEDDRPQRRAPPARRAAAEEPPARNAASLADRRRALRR